MSTTIRARLALTLALTAATACAPAQLGLHRATAAPFATRDMISEAELAGVPSGTAYEAVRRLRPTFLSWTRSVTPYERRLVFVDGIQMGGLEALEAIPTMSIREIRLLTGIEAAGRYGTTNSAGALIVTTKLGPHR
jgi:hypothetical protein